MAEAPQGRVTRGRPGARGRRAVLLGLVCALLLVGALAARAVTGPATPASSYRTATAATRDVAQRLTLTGTVARVEQVTAAFPVSGTVTSLKVTVGDEVTIGQVLASIDRAPLSAALLEAKSSLASAKATLESDSTSGSSNGSAAASGGGSGSGSGASTAALGGVMGRLDTAMRTEQRACGPVFGSSASGGPGSPTSPTSTSPTSTPTSPTATSPTSTPTSPTSTSPTSTPTSPTSTSPTSTPTSPTSTSPTSTPTSPTSTPPSPTGPTTAQLLSCQKALASLARVESKAFAALSAAARSTSGATSTRASTTGSGSSASSAARLVLDQLAVTTAEQAVAQAETDLAAATLHSPVDGVVGSVGLSVGATAGTTTGVEIVGAGAAEVTVDVPLAQRTSLADGERAYVVPAGSTEALEASVRSIGILPSSSSTGSTTVSYPVVVLVPEAPQALASGARAQVSFVIATADNAVTVPVSALTSLTTGSAFVQVIDGGVATRTAVSTGAVGRGYVEITDGLAPGNVVVLADLTADLPANSTQNLRRLTGGGGFNGPPGGGSGPMGGSGPRPGG